MFTIKNQSRTQVDLSQCISTPLSGIAFAQLYKKRQRDVHLKKKKVKLTTLDGYSLYNEACFP